MKFLIEEINKEKKSDMIVIWIYNFEQESMLFCTTLLDKNGISSVIAAPDKRAQ